MTNWQEMKTKSVQFEVPLSVAMKCCYNSLYYKPLQITKMICQKWDSNPRPQSGLRPERSALDHSAILTRCLPSKMNPFE